MYHVQGLEVGIRLQDHKDCQRTASSQVMDIAKMLNVTILACLLILTGCFGLGATDDDVIDDAEGQDTGSGTTTVVNTYPPVQALRGNGTIHVDVGEYVELLSVYIHSPTSHLLLQANGVYLEANCTTIQESVYATTLNQNHVYLPSDGSACTYDFASTIASPDSHPESIIYRVWS